MKWQNKARIQRFCANMPHGDRVYQLILKKFGNLKATPKYLFSRIRIQKRMIQWLLEEGLSFEGKTVFEVGTGHIPIAPIGFFLSGAKSVIMVDTNVRMDLNITRDVLGLIIKHRDEIQELYKDTVSDSIFNERFAVVEKFHLQPERFLEEANISYRAPADAAHTSLPSESVDIHFSITTLEHIPPNVIGDIFSEGYRILTKEGVAVHHIDLSDHFRHQDNSITTINFLRFTEDEWNRIAGNEYSYCNRIRASDYYRIFEEKLFRTIRCEARVDNNAIEELKNGFPLDASFNKYDPEDLCTTTVNIMLGK